MKNLHILKGNEVLIYLNGLTRLRTILDITTTPKNYAVVQDNLVYTSNDLERTIKAIVNNCPLITKDELTIIDVKSYKDMLLNELRNK